MTIQEFLIRWFADSARECASRQAVTRAKLTTPHVARALADRETFQEERQS